MFLVLFITILINLALGLFLSQTLALGATQEDNVECLNRLISYYSATSECDDWEVLGLRWAGIEAGVKYTPGDIINASDYARAILGHIAAGSDEHIVEGYIDDLQTMQNAQGNFNTGDNASLNQNIWAVIALDFAQENGYEVNYDRSAVITYICSQQQENGGFDESGWGEDVDGTAHTLIALAPYQNEHEEVIEKALDYLHTKQLDTGAFDNWGENTDSTATVIEALVSLNIDPLSEEWLKGENNMVDALLGYQLESGAFYPAWDGDKNANSMTTRNALLAMSDLVKGKSKYHNTMPATTGLTLSIKTESDLVFDSDAQLNISLFNNNNEAVETLTIIGLYNTQNDQMLQYNSLATLIASKATANLRCGFTIPEQGQYKVIVYVWDNWDEQNPLTSPGIIEVN